MVSENQPEHQKSDGTQSHDPAYPPKFVEFMRTGWRDIELPTSQRPEAPNYAKRRAALSSAFPGETVVVPSGREMVRANDTNFPFRPGSDFVYLTGEHDPDSVLVLRPDGSGGHDEILYTRGHSPRDNDEFFKDRTYGELWIGRRHTLGEKSAALGIECVRLVDIPLDDFAPGRTRVLRDIDPFVDVRVRETTHDRARTTNWPGSSPSSSSSRTSGSWPSCRTPSTPRSAASRTWPAVPCPPTVPSPSA